MPVGVDHRAYFALVAAVMDEVDGRPHWGKLHSLDSTRLRELYPRFDEFTSVRGKLDPAGIFANAELDRILGPQ
jgi:FAD/FMN-containing dehydrogenase